MKNQKRQAGFTLIELMIVIAIIGILMAYAIPAYRDYTVRSMRGECNAVLDGLKTPIAEWRYAHTDYPADKGEVFLTGTTQGTHVLNVDFTSGGTVVCNMTSTAGGGTITWSASYAAGDANIRWSCADNLKATKPAQEVCPK